MYASTCGAILEIRPFGCLRSNAECPRTPLGGQFDWGGRLQKRNGGFQRCPRADWQPAFIECNGIRALDWEADMPSRQETGA